MVPGEYLFDGPEVELNAGRPTATLRVNNTGDRPVQVGSHFHFFEANRALVFERERAYGMRLDLPAGTAVRFEPGEVKEVRLVPLGGARVAHGGNGLVMGPLDDAHTRRQALERLRQAGFDRPGQKSVTPQGVEHSVKLSRAAYAGHYGPTVGDRIRLADTNLLIEVEKDFAVYGEEVVFGGGKVIRDGQGQSAYQDPKAPAHLAPLVGVSPTESRVCADLAWGFVRRHPGCVFLVPFADLPSAPEARVFVPAEA